MGVTTTTAKDMGETRGVMVGTRAKAGGGKGARTRASR